MFDFNSNLADNNSKQDSISSNPEIQDYISTKLNSSIFPTSFIPPYQLNPMLFPSNDELINSTLFNDNNIFNDSCDNLFINNEDEIVDPMQKVFSMNIDKNEEKSKTESIEYPHIVTEIDGKVCIAIKNKGRKTNKEKSTGITGGHNKYSHDNKLRKVKVIAFEAIFRTINLLLKNIDANKQLKRLNNEQTKELGVLYNRKLLLTKIKYIFSNDISSKYKDKPDYNKKIIKSIYEEKGKYAKVIEILEKTLEECFQDFRDKDNENELKKIFKKIFDEKLKKETKEYKNDITDIINDFEKIYRGKKNPRISRKKSNKK